MLWGRLVSGFAMFLEQGLHPILAFFGCAVGFFDQVRFARKFAFGGALLNEILGCFDFLFEMIVFAAHVLGRFFAGVFVTIANEFHAIGFLHLRDEIIDRFGKRLGFGSAQIQSEDREKNEQCAHRILQLSRRIFIQQ